MLAMLATIVTGAGAVMATLIVVHRQARADLRQFRGEVSQAHQSAREEANDNHRDLIERLDRLVDRG